MADSLEPRRPKRRCVSSKSAMPSAIHYVGYVEEEETPEMIMKKFEEMEKVMAAGGSSKAPAPAKEADEWDTDPEEEQEDAAQPEQAAAADAGQGGPSGEAAVAGGQDEALTEAQLMEIFKQTSIFNVRSALANNDALMSSAAGAHCPEERDWEDEELSDDEELWAEMREFWSDEELDDQDARAHWRRLRRGGPGKDGQRRPRAPRAGGAGKPRHSIVTHYNAITQAFIRRKVRVVDKDVITRILVPGPLPLSWGRTVRPYAPPPLPARGLPRVGQLPGGAESASSPGSDENRDTNGDACAGAAAAATTVEPVLAGGARREACVLYREEADLTRANFKALSKGGFQGVLVNRGWEVEGTSGDPAVGRLAKLPLTQLCPTGFVFVWAAKEHLAAVVGLLYDRGYAYVENLTWVRMAPNNTVLTDAAPYAQRSHLTLFIFRRAGEGKDIELRHQRNPDVLFDCVQQHRGTPEEAFVAIETLLPTGHGKFLELWAPEGASRPGWTHLAELQPAKGGA